MTRSKKRIHLPPSFDVKVEEWQQFIDGIPGRSYDGVDIETDDNGDAEIVAGYGKSRDDRVEYTATQKTEMQAYAGAMAGNVSSINDAKAG